MLRAVSNTHRLDRAEDGWDRFWVAWKGHQIAKNDAQKAWRQLRPSPELVETILAALAWQLPLWESQGYGRPYPATYLRGERWTDERPAPPRQAVSAGQTRLEAWAARGVAGIGAADYVLITGVNIWAAAAERMEVS